MQNMYRIFCVIILLPAVNISPLYAAESDSGNSDVVQEQQLEVFGITPTHGVGLPESKIPYTVQSATSADISSSQSLDISDFMNRNLGSVSVNDVQNNPLQKDIQFRGFTASPLLGVPQGLAIYQNGVRINEVLGDTINWDLIPDSSIDSINLIGGANPLYGLNTLGGAISITTKNGFTNPGNDLKFSGGSFQRFITTAESGANNGRWGYFTTVNYFDEAGWRTASPSNALTEFTSLSFRDGITTSLDLNFNYADTELIGNGPLPFELLTQDRSTVFTTPDITRNRLYFIDMEGSHWMSDQVQVSGNVFYRDNDVNTFNGDSTEFDQCSFNSAILCTIDGGVESSIEDQNGNNVASSSGGNLNNAINNASSINQRNYGGSIQATFLRDLFNRENQLILGTAYNQGFAELLSTVEIGSLNPDRSTKGIGLFIPDEGTFVDTMSKSWSLYATDTLGVTDRLDLTLSARYNNTSIRLNDIGGLTSVTSAAPALNGDHSYDRLNPAAGLNYKFTSWISGYTNYSESSRAPTPIELACADPTAPCNLPNTFLSDPPLNQVVAKSYEAGLRGRFDQVKWHAGGFQTTNVNDIIFIGTGGSTSNQGFFSNVGDTQRLGMEFGLDGRWKQLDWYLNYSHVEATFETAFKASSPNHPFADANGEIQVKPGDRIPGIPANTLKFGGTYSITPRLSIGTDIIYNSGSYLRGDESNQLNTTDDYVVVNLTGNYSINKTLRIFARIDNLFDTDYETFGLLGDPTAVPAFSGFTNPRFLGPGAPISGFIGFEISI